MSPPTPEQRAAAIIHDGKPLPGWMRDLIADAIRDAVAAEREACAKISENHKPRWANLSAGEDYISSDPMSGIAEAIRSQP